MNFHLKWMTLFIFLCATTIMQAQQKDKFKPQLMLGVGGGPIFSTVDFVPKVPQSTTQGLSAGISAKYISEKNLGVLAELNYTQRGWTEDFSELPKNPDHAYSRTLNYVELPLLTHIYFGNKVRFILNVGPQISYMFGDNAKMNDALSNYMKEEQEKDPDNPIGIQYKSIDSNFDYGLLGGLGLEFGTPVGSFNLEGRYYFGLGDSFDNSRKKVGNFSRSAHRYFAGKLTYFFFSL